jgi:phage tail sheath protein FI
MPIQPSYPGVYIQEISSGVRTITGVSTSIAAFFGRTLKGPIDKAVGCFSYSDFLRAFGGPHKASDLASSVRQFFDNGGSQCYVVRLAKGAAKASLSLKNAAGTNVLEIKAKDAGKWGNNVRLEIDYATMTPDETFNLRVFHVDGANILANEAYSNIGMVPDSPRNAASFVNASSSLVELKQLSTTSTQGGFSESRRPILATDVTALCTSLNNIIYNPTGPSKFEISVDNGDFTEVDLKKTLPTPLDPTVAAFNSINKVLGKLTTEINDQIPPDVKIPVSLIANIDGDNNGLLRITSVPPVGDSLSVKIRPATSSDVAAPLMLGVDQGGIERSRFADLRPLPNGTFFSGAINDLAKLKQNEVSKIEIIGASFPGNNLDLGTALVTTANGDRWHRDAFASSRNGNSDGVREKLTAIANAIGNAATLPVTAIVKSYFISIIPKTGLFSSSFGLKTGDTLNAPTGAVSGGVDLSGSFTQNNRQYALGDTVTNSSQTAGALGRDDDGIPATPDIDVTSYFGSELDKTGFYALDKVDIFNLMILPGDRDINESQYEQLSVAASAYCEKHRAFLLLDAPSDWSKDGNLNRNELKYNEIRNGMVKTHSAIFYPRVKFSDAGTMKYIGASGMIAGVMARTDSQRGVWKAPAGIEADLRGAFDLEVNLTDNENGLLNKQAVNCIRTFPNGVVSWGSRTLDGFDDNQTEWKYIPIRRLALFLEESLYRGTKWVVFEPNDEPLWAKIRMNINAFMTSLFRQGAFQGSTPDKAFFVKCDGETTTANDRNLGIVNIIVGFAPLKPAEFVIISIQQIPDV